jgi:hypothetical protein
MSKLMQLQQQCKNSLKLQRLIVCTFSSIVCSVKAHFNPYFDFVVEIIKPYLSMSSSSNSSLNGLSSYIGAEQVKQSIDSKLLQIECIDLMGVLAKHVGKDKFNQVLIGDCLSFVQSSLNNESDPEIRSGAYDLLAGLVSGKLKEQLPLKQIMPQLIETLRSEEGINVYVNDV